MSAYSIYSDKELLGLLKVEGEDVHAFSEIYKRYFKVLERHGLRKIDDADQVKDVLHDLFLKFWTNREVITITTSLSAYLYTATKNRILNVLLQDRYIERSVSSMKENFQEGVFATIEEDVFLAEMKAKIEREVEKLPSKMRQIFELSRFKELSHKEIAETLNITENNVKKQIQNALKILKPKLLVLILFILFK